MKARIPKHREFIINFPEMCIRDRYYYNGC